MPEGTEYQNRMTGTIETDIPQNTSGEPGVGGSNGQVNGQSPCIEVEYNATPGETGSNKNKQLKQSANRNVCLKTQDKCLLLQRSGAAEAGLCKKK